LVKLLAGPSLAEVADLLLAEMESPAPAAPPEPDLQAEARLDPAIRPGAS
ncbi:MAG: hypothetical protein JOY51_00910, partial [Nevskia sp.]|nr:hypothetical protein [Nevskia sp.]